MKPARLAVLGIAIAAGGTAAFLASRSEAPLAVTVGVAPPAPANTVDVLVAKKDIGIGQSLLPQDMEWAAWPASTVQFRPMCAGPTGRMPSSSLPAGRRARRSPAASRSGKAASSMPRAPGYVAAILPSGMRAVATEISAETGAGGFILPNDRVDVILSRRDREAERLTGIETQVAETLLSDVKVLAIDQHVEDKTGRAMVGRTATLELSPRQVETLAMGRLMGTLSLALRSLADADPSKRGSTHAPGRSVPQGSSISSASA